MRVDYDRDANVLHVTTETPAATAASLLDEPSVAVELAAEDGHDIVGIIVMGASAYLPLPKDCKEYCVETDTLFIGEKAIDPNLVTRNGDIVGYWRKDEDDPDGFRDPIGVAIERASRHLSTLDCA